MQQRVQTAARQSSGLRSFVDFPLIALLLSLAVFVLAWVAGLRAAALVPEMPTFARMLVEAAIIIGPALAVYKFGIARLGQPARDDLPWGGAASGLGFGLLFGAVLFAAVVGVAAIADVYNIVGEGTTDDLVRLAIMSAILPGFMEEVLFRGILFRWFEAFLGSWLALLLTSAMFGVAHIFNPGATWFSSFAIAMEAGLLLGGAYMLTRNLWMPIGLHAAWNFTQGAIFDVKISGTDGEGVVDARLSGPELLSGGGFGLEGSIIAIAVASMAGVWLIVLAVRRGHILPPSWSRRGQS